MTMRPPRNRRDTTQAAIVAALQAAGATVVDTSMVGRGFPDLVVGFRGQTYLLEVKAERGRLRQSQAEFRMTWRGGPIFVVRSPDEALKAIGVV